MPVTIKNSKKAYTWRQFLSPFFYPNGPFYKNIIAPTFSASGQMDTFLDRIQNSTNRERKDDHLNATHMWYHAHEQTLEPVQANPLSTTEIPLNRKAPENVIDCLRLAPQRLPNPEQKKIIIKIFGLTDCMERHLGRESHAEVIAHPKAGFITYMLNLPGTMNSTYPMLGADEAVLQLKELVKVIISQERQQGHVNPEDIVIYGHSMGGMFASLVAAELHKEAELQKLNPSDPSPPLRIRAAIDRSFANFIWSYVSYSPIWSGLVSGVLYGLVIAFLHLLYGALSTLLMGLSVLQTATLAAGFLSAITAFLPTVLYGTILGLAIGFVIPDLAPWLAYPFGKILAKIAGWDLDPGKAFESIPPSHRYCAWVEKDPTIGEDFSLKERLLSTRDKFTLQINTLIKYLKNTFLKHSFKNRLTKELRDILHLWETIDTSRTSRPMSHEFIAQINILRKSLKTLERSSLEKRLFSKTILNLRESLKVFFTLRKELEEELRKGEDVKKFITQINTLQDFINALISAKKLKNTRISLDLWEKNHTYHVSPQEDRAMEEMGLSRHCSSPVNLRKNPDDLNSPSLIDNLHAWMNNWVSLDRYLAKGTTRKVGEKVIFVPPTDIPVTAHLGDPIRIWRPACNYGMPDTTNRIKAGYTSRCEVKYDGFSSRKASSRVSPC